MNQLSLLPRVSGAVTVSSPPECNALLSEYHYLGPVSSGVLWLGWYEQDELVQCQVYRHPSSRHIDPTWLELSRWCIGPTAGRNAGSRFHAGAVRLIRSIRPDATTLVSYSELGRHTGALYRSCNWEPMPTHHAIRYEQDGQGYPSGHGSWDGVTTQQPKMRWVFHL